MMCRFRLLVAGAMIALLAFPLSAFDIRTDTRIIPSCARGRICTREDLWQILGQTTESQRECGVDYLRRLGAAHRDLIEESLTSPYRDVRGAALDALVCIGDERAKAVIRGILQDPKHPFTDTRRLAAALARARDTASAPLLRQLAAESDDMHLGRWYTRVARYIEAANWGESIFDVDRRGVVFRFLLDDIESIRTVGPLRRTIREFEPEEFRPICEELQKAYPARVVGVDGVAQLVITLSDGREGRIEITFDDVFASEFSYYFRGPSFTVQSPALTSLLGRPREYVRSGAHFEAQQSMKSESSNSYEASYRQ